MVSLVFIFLYLIVSQNYTQDLGLNNEMHER